METITILFDSVDSEAANTLMLYLTSFKYNFQMLTDYYPTKGDDLQYLPDKRISALDPLSTDAVIAILSSASKSSPLVLSTINQIVKSEAINAIFLKIIVIGPSPLSDFVPKDHILRVDGTFQSQVEEITTALGLEIQSFVIEREKEKVSLKVEKIETNSAMYIEEAIASLKEREDKNRLLSYVCFILGFLSMAIGAGFAIWGLSHFQTDIKFEWYVHLYTGIKSLIIITLLIACSRYAFNLGKDYLNEALKNADRIHAISFGKFYLKTFPENVSWQELKEVLQHWNFTGNSPIASSDANQFDPKLLEKTIDLAKAMIGKSDEKKDSK